MSQVVKKVLAHVDTESIIGDIDKVLKMFPQLDF